jgi:hypothetical protein
MQWSNVLCSQLVEGDVVEVDVGPAAMAAQSMCVLNLHFHYFPLAWGCWKAM